MRRRDFLRATLASLPGMALWPGCADEASRPTVDGTEYFPNGIASGDPRPDSVVLWARVVDPDLEDQDIELELDISRSEEFEGGVQTVSIVAQSSFDHCAKVKLSDLEPDTVYFYRFVYVRDGEHLASRVGRTHTAPAVDADRAVRFAFVSCQDYNGRYYNNYVALAREELDFVVHLGDYVYETTGDPVFQDTQSERRVVFGDIAGAIIFNEGEDDEYYAARSLDNYRDLYRTYRSDLALQLVHERFPMIIIWDDHEFSNDCHGATATYFGGRVDETDVARRQNANQAWFEYMPVDYPGDDDFAYDPDAAWPQDIRIHRDFRFGRHLHLVMTDARTWRTDHIIPEDAFPGAVAVEQSTLEQVLGEVPADAAPYVDIESLDGGSYKDALMAAAGELDFDPDRVSGSISVRWINETLEEIGSPLSPITNTDALPRGLAFIDMGKSGYYGAVGSRNLVVKPTYDAYGEVLWKQSGGESEHVLGPAQEAWFFDLMEASTHTWKVWGNEYALAQIAVDLSGFAIPDEFQKLWYLTVDLWDGHRNRRNEMIERLSAVGGVVAITGDIHAFHAATPMANRDPSKKIVEFVTSSISSATFKEELDATVESTPSLSEFSEAKQLVELTDFLLNSPDLQTNPHLPWSDSTRHGYVVVELDGEKLEATYSRLAPDLIREDYADRPDEIDEAFEIERFRVNAGEPELHRWMSGEWRRWDPSAFEWI